VLYYVLFFLWVRVSVIGPACPVGLLFLINQYVCMYHFRHSPLVTIHVRIHSFMGYGTLSGNHGRFFRIRHVKSSDVSLGWPVNVSSYTVVFILIIYSATFLGTNSVSVLMCRKAVNQSISYRGNHKSQIKSYYGTLSGSRGRSFRIRHEKSLEAPPGA